MRNSFRDLEKRISRIERRVQPPTPCNCRTVARYHDANCLAAILEKTPRECPVHGFREMGFFFWVPPSDPLFHEDNEVCPCPPHPWRSFQLSGGPYTKEARDAAMDAWQDMPREPSHNVEENRARTDAVFQAYLEQKEQWLRKTGRRLPSLEELRDQWERAGKRPPR